METYKLCQFNIDHIKSVRRLDYLCQQSALTISDFQNSSIDDDMKSHFIQLSQADDVGVEFRDVVDTPKRLMFSSLAVEQDGVDTLILNN